MRVRTLEFERWFWMACEVEEQAVRPLREALDAWLGEFRLDSRWCEATALATVRAWEAQPEGEPLSPRWFTPASWTLEAHSGERDRLLAHLPMPDGLLDQTPSELRSQLLSGIERAVDDHLAGLVEEAAERALPMARVAQASEHVEWLVRSQVLRESNYRISQRAGCDPKTVKEAVDRLRAYLGLPKPPRRRAGRPPGAKTVKPQPRVGPPRE
jgi:hypothetical protein